MSKAFNIGATASAAADSAIGQGLGIVFGKMQDKRQVNQQKKLTGIQVGANKELAEHSQGLQMDMWNKTNYGAQIEHMKKAGLNPALAYGMSGGGGVTAGGASAGTTGGGTAEGASAGVGMGMQMAAQMKLLQAQTENIQADTDNKKADAGYTQGAKTENTIEEAKGKSWENEVRTLLTAGKEAERRTDEADITGIRREEKNAAWELAKEIGYEQNFISKDSPIAKAMIAGWSKTIIDLENAKKDGNIKTAQTAIEEYKANLAKEGIDPNSPWYLKILTTLASKIGLSPTELIKEQIKK